MGLERRFKKQGGNVQVLMLLLCSVFVVAGFGTLGIFRAWRFQMETQLRLNTCIGKPAQTFRDSLNSLLKTNQRIRKIRAALAVIVLPSSQAPLRALLQTAVLYQEGLLLKWDANCAAWIVNRGCGLHYSDFPNPLPRLGLFRPPPDPLGPRPLEWSPGGFSFRERRFRFRISHSARVAAAEVLQRSENTNDWKTSEEQSEAMDESANWTAEWKWR
ncbi:MAG: hypothetical protein HYX41_01730 [Bdellovibrio sp.]|nr:hypothetical protein [Bdellovibrio sp.]